MSPVGQLGCQHKWKATQIHKAICIPPLTKKSFSLLFWAIIHQGLCSSSPRSTSPCLHLWTQSPLVKPRLLPVQHSKPEIFASLQRPRLVRSPRGPAVSPGPPGPALTTARLSGVAILDQFASWSAVDTLTGEAGAFYKHHTTLLLLLSGSKIKLHTQWNDATCPFSCLLHISICNPTPALHSVHAFTSLFNISVKILRPF